MALRTLRLSLLDTWQELGSVLVIQLLFLLGILLILPAPPATLALFFYGYRIVQGEMAGPREYLQASREYWAPAWRWGLLNLMVIGLLLGDYWMTGTLAMRTDVIRFMQGLYVTLMTGWCLLQLFVPPFLFAQEQPSVLQALRNAFVFTGRNPGFVLLLGLLLCLSLAVGTLAFMLSFAFGGAFLAFASSHAVLDHLAKSGVS